MIDQLRAATQALQEGDPDPFASLFAEEAEWRGVSNGHLWWKHTPSCRGPAGARETLAFAMKKRGLRAELEPEFTMLGGDKIIGSTSWSGGDGRQRERWQVLTIRDGKIVDMQGFKSRREAERFARRNQP